MNRQYYLPFLLPLFLNSCINNSKTLPPINEKASIIVDSSLSNSIRKSIQLTSWKKYSRFKTPVEAIFFSNGQQTHEINEKDYELTSWYSSHSDTIDLVSHLSDFESVALLIRFVKGKPKVLFLRAPHESTPHPRFKINQTDSFTHHIEVPPGYYHLKLSEIPDTIRKHVIYGYIDMESGTYYDTRDSIETKRKVQMKFAFRSQYIKFEEY